VKPDIVQDYVATGDVFIEYRDFAFLGEESQRAAEAALCAADQDAFWHYNETLFLNQQTPPSNQGGYSTRRLLEMGEAIGLDMDQFESCVNDRTYRDEVDRLREEAQATGITGTPQFQLNGRVLQLANYEELRQEIEAELIGAN
jgi:protein-disulfide isomerase